MYEEQKKKQAPHPDDIHAIIERGCRFEEALSKIQAQPELAKKLREADKRYPLHVATCLSHHCKNDETLHDLIMRLVELNPEAVGHKDKFGKLPIQYAAPDTCVGMIKLLMNKCPPKAAVDRSGPDSDVGQRYRLQMALIQMLGDESQDNAKTLFYAISTGRLDIFMTIIKKNDALVKSVDSMGNLLHHKAAAHCCKEMLEYLVTKYPEGLLHRNKMGNLPIECCGEDEQFFLILAKCCPRALLRPDRTPFAAVLDNLHKYSATKKRVDVMEEVFALVMRNQYKHNPASAVLLEEKEHLMRKIKQQAKEFHEETARLRKSHQAQLNRLEQLHRPPQPTPQTTRPQPSEALLFHGSLDSEGRKFDKIFLSQLVQPDSNASMEELRSFASSLKIQLDVTVARTPSGQPCALQKYYHSIVQNPNLTKGELVEFIRDLDWVLTQLEEDMAKAAARSVSPEATNQQQQRQAKRARVSLP